MKKYLFFLSFAFVSCKSQQLVIEEPIVDEIYVPAEEDYTEERTLEEVEIVAPRGFALPRYNPASRREFDLIHTDLEIRFDWVHEHVLGRAIITVKPYFYAQQYLMLDAKGMDIQSVTDDDVTPLPYQYNGQKLDIDLGRPYGKEESITLTIDYIAKPSEGEEGGSAAITSDKGLFFINADGSSPNKPKQIWTQGETENNSRWFPTIDKPNENMTQTVKVTVEEKYKTLSNGTLTRSVANGDGTRTDHWDMNDPHAPYLAMLTVGEFAVVKDKWRDIDLAYYVEKEYEPYAKQIFAHTPEMLEFFSSILDFPYPWDKYSQVIVRDYVSGAMENTTAVIYGDFIQKTDRELIDDDNDYIVAHEMFHHWFGDLVTCESWANLTLQEGFANYSEYLWKEYKYKNDEADYHRANERTGYFNSILQTGIHPLIHYGFGDKEEMFDGHSYNKGGLVLHMLRRMIGDEAFFAGLNKYLKDNQHTAVEVDELRMAFQDVSGLDLNWFFDQWYLAAGHPEIKIDYSYNEVSKEIVLNIEQTQDPDSSPPIFQIPVVFSAFDESGRETIYELMLDKREQQIRLDHPTKPALTLFDRDDNLLMIKDQSKSAAEYEKQYQWSNVYAHRIEAIKNLGSTSQEVLMKALDDIHFSIRTMAVQKIKTADNPVTIERLKYMATNDVHSKVRGAALKKLSDITGFDIKGLTEKVLDTEQSYTVIANALEVLNKVDGSAAMAQAIKYKDAKTTALINSLSSILSSSGDASHLGYFEDRLTTISLYSVFNFYEDYYALLSTQSVETQLEKAIKLKAIATDESQNLFYKYTSTSMINKLQEDFSTSNVDVAATLKAMVEEIKSQETNSLLIERYSAF